MRRRLQGDDGAYAILYALLVLVVLGMASIVVDLGLLRADKRDSRSAADNAALAGAHDLGFGPYAPRAACQAAWAYALDNLGLADTSSPCSSATPGSGFAASVTTCSGTPQTATGTVSGVTISITWPVPSTSALMLDPDGEPASGTPRTYDADFDGTTLGCDRLGVQVSRERSLGLAAGLGVGKGASYAGSVARAVLKPGDDLLPYPLVVLDPRSCNSLAVSGGTTVLVKNKLDLPGRIGIDSDGTETGNGQDVEKCGGGKYVSDAAGTGSRIEAQDGNTGLPGAIEAYGPATLSANAYDPADLPCTSACMKPRPTVRSQRVTRIPFQTLYNCGTACPGGSPERAYVDRFGAVATSLTGTPSGWQTISGAACTTAPPAPLTTPARYFVDCGTTYSVSGSRSFPPGATVVINGNLKIENGGCLVFNAAAGTGACSASGVSGPPFESTNAMVSVRGNIFSGGTTARLVMPETFVHQPLTTSRLEGSGFDLIAWTAPYVHPDDVAAQCPPLQSVATIPPVACFRNLSFWTDAPSPNNAPAIITGGGLLELEGTFFLGEAKLRLAGGGIIDVNNAQFVAKRIEASGGSLLTFIPNPERTTPLLTVGVGLVR